FSKSASYKPTLRTNTTRYDQSGKPMVGVENSFDTKIFDGNRWGLQWKPEADSAPGNFPQYYKHEGDQRKVVKASDVPKETNLGSAEFNLAPAGAPYTSPTKGAWATPGPKRGPFKVKLTDGSIVTYSWYRFVDQPSFQQYKWSTAKKQKLQALVEKIHRSWKHTRDYMAPPSSGTLVSLDPALLVTPPKGMEVGFVPIVTGQMAVPK
ncbi:MAG TPA: hypothetical protein VK171_01615, partial [Fimbriimonas sp.]|nr:hypothetical protein [Fimbriimonas sp.]